MKQIQSLKTTNGIIFAFSLIGSLILTYVGVFQGECIDYCGASYAEYIPNPTLIGFGIAGLLISTLTFQVINLFAFHVENSHSNQ